MPVLEKDLAHIERVAALIEHFKARYSDPAIAALAALAVVNSVGSAVPVRADVYTVAEAAERLKVDPRTVYRLCESGAISCIRIGTGKKRATLRITAAALDAYVNSPSEMTSVSPPRVLRRLPLAQK